MVDSANRKNEGAASNARSYSDARQEILNGDVLMYRGRSRLSRWIRTVTRSPYSHAGIAMWWEGRLMVLEAVRSGVVVTLMSANVSHYDGGVEWFRCRMEIDGERRTRMVRFAQDQLGKKYALWMALVVMFALLFNWKKGRRDELRRTGSLFCSHLVAQVYNTAGLDLKKGLEDRFMSPCDIADSPLMEKVAVLKHEDGRISWWKGLGKQRKGT
jgi:hypothetical protein